MEEQRQAFIDYLIENEYAESTVYSYSRGIDRISAHISDLKNSAFKIYGLTDVERLKKISFNYDTNGNFSEIGNEGHGTIRNSIKRFVEFIEWQKKNDNKGNNSKTEEVYQSEENVNKEKNILEHSNITDNEKTNEIKLIIENLNKQNKNSYQNLIKIVFILQIIILAFLILIYFYKF